MTNSCVIRHQLVNSELTEWWYQNTGVLVISYVCNLLEWPPQSCQKLKLHRLEAYERCNISRHWKPRVVKMPNLIVTDGSMSTKWSTVKPIYNDHLYNKFLFPVIYSVACFHEDGRYQFTLASNFCLLEHIYVALGHLDELQKAEKYPIGWSL